MQKVITLYMQEERLKAFVKKNSMGIVNKNMLSSKDMVSILVATPKNNATTRYEKNISIHAPCFTAELVHKKLCCLLACVGFSMETQCFQSTLYLLNYPKRSVERWTQTALKYSEFTKLLPSVWKCTKIKNFSVGLIFLSLSASAFPHSLPKSQFLLHDP